MQAGFDFGEAREIKPIEMPRGTWERNSAEPDVSLASVMTLAHRAVTNLTKVPASVRAFFEAGVHEFEAELAGLADKAELNRWDLRELRNFRLEAGMDDFEAFKKLCREQSALAPQPEGIHWKVREQIDDTCYAICVEDVGLLMFQQYFTWNEPALKYVPPSFADSRCADTFFLHSYADDAQSIAMPYKLWGPSFAADKIAYSNKGQASVPTFRYGGREYVVTSGSYGTKGGCKYAIGTAWSLCPRSEWPGKTYSYAEHGELLEHGIQQCSDYRGIGVLVRGQPMVIESAMFVYDLNAEPLTYTLSDETEASDDDLDTTLLANECEEEEEALA